MTECEKEHYFDWAATAIPEEDILNKALDESIKTWGNPSSIHKIGSAASRALDAARKKCAKVLGVSPESIVFTSGGTEGDCIPLLSMLTRPYRGTILKSSIEHDAISAQSSMLRLCGWNVSSIPASKDGFITKESVLSHLTSDTALVCVMAVNNETGAVQPIKEIVQGIKEATKGKRRPKFHVDCVQACGKIPIDLSSWDVDSASFSAHKIGGARGSGILYVKGDMTPFLRSGGQERDIRGGTENLAGAISFADCLERYYILNKKSESYERVERQRLITQMFINQLKTLPCCSLIPDSRNGSEEEGRFSPWVLQASFCGIPGQVMVRALDSKGFYISTGSACSLKKHTRPVLEAMNVSPDSRESAVRFSFGYSTTKKGVEELFEAVKDVCLQFGKA